MRHSACHTERMHHIAYELHAPQCMCYSERHTSSIDKSIFGTGKFFKEQSIEEKKNDIYEEIDEAIKKAPDEEK